MSHDHGQSTTRVTLQAHGGANRFRQESNQQDCTFATAGDAIMDTAREQSVAVTECNVLYGTTSTTFDQSYAETATTSSKLPHQSHTVYAHIDRSAKRRTEVSISVDEQAAPPPPQSVYAQIDRSEKSRAKVPM